MNTEIQVLQQIKTSLVSFLDECIESFPEETDFVLFRIFVSSQIPITEIAEYIASELSPLHEMVKKKDEKFFLEKDVFFNRFQDKMDKVNHFKRLWQSPKTDKENKDTIWEWFDHFCKLGNKYIELKGK